MIGVLIPGSPIITRDQLSTNFEVDVKDIKNIDTIGIFLTKSIPDDCGAAIYYSIPSSQTQNFIGYICNKNPSDIFFVSWRSDPEVNTYHSLKICIKLEKLKKLENPFSLPDMPKEEADSLKAKTLEIPFEAPSEVNIQNQEYDSSSFVNTSSFQPSQPIEINSLETEIPITQENTALYSGANHGIDAPELQNEIIPDYGKDNALTFGEAQFTNNENIESEYIPQINSIPNMNLEQEVNNLPSNEESPIQFTATDIQQDSSQYALQETSELSKEPVNEEYNTTVNIENSLTEYNLQNEALLSNNLSTPEILQPSQTIPSSDLNTIPGVPLIPATTFDNSNTIANEDISSLQNSPIDDFKDNETEVAIITPLKGSFAVSRKNKIVGRYKFAHVTPMIQQNNF